MMKFTLVVGLFIAATVEAFAQGSGGVFNFSNVGTTPDRHVYVGDYLGPVKAEGNDYQIAIFWGPAGTTDENALVQIGNPIGFLSGPAADGRFSGGARTITGQGSGPVLAFQARAWYAANGDDTWAEAVANPAGRIGKNPVFDMKTQDPIDPFENVPNIGSAAGWRGFAVAVPEPSAVGLALLGVAALLVFRRRR